jgi:hypothetical protein
MVFSFKSTDLKITKMKKGADFGFELLPSAGDT